MGPPQYKSVNVMGSLIGINRFEIHDVAHHRVLIRDTVAAVHVTGHSGNVQRFATVVALHQRDVFDGQRALIEIAALITKSKAPFGHLRTIFEMSSTVLRARITRNQLLPLMRSSAKTGRAIRQYRIKTSKATNRCSKKNIN